MRSEPIVLLPFVEGNLESPDRNGQNAEANEIETRLPYLLLDQVRRIFDELENEDDCQNSHGYVDIKNPTPAAKCSCRSTIAIRMEIACANKTDVPSGRSGGALSG